jgi:HD-GYP domain-containing protein (c-di-GMP phosphodiesterase class II)
MVPLLGWNRLHGGGEGSAVTTDLGYDRLLWHDTRIETDDLEGTVEEMLETARAQLGLELTVLSEGPGNEAVAPSRPPPIGASNEAGVAAVPLRLSDGRLYGTLHCGSDHGRDPEAVRLLAQLIVDRIERRTIELERWRSTIASTGVQALLAALEARDGYVKEHSEAVVELSAIAGHRMGLSAGTLDDVKQVALLHDLGKIAIPEPILAKPGALEAAEREQLMEHPAIGARIVASIGSLSHLAPAIRAGHERWDGLGYPDGLAGEDIPLASRIVSLCDAYHAMVSHRPYRRAVPHDDAIAEVVAGAGTQFCPTSVASLTAAL